MLDVAVGLVMGYLVQKGRRAASRADEQVDRVVDACVDGFGALLGRRAARTSGPPAAAAIPAVAAPSTSSGAERRWAVVESPASAVHHEPDSTRGPLKYKYRHDQVELFTHVAPREGWIAVRTPMNAPGYKWMRADELRVVPSSEPPDASSDLPDASSDLPNASSDLPDTPPAPRDPSLP